MDQVKITTNVSDMSISYLSSYSNKEVLSFPLKPGEQYGPFYYIGKENFCPSIPDNSTNDSERNTFLGFTKPINKIHAEELYNIKKSNKDNPFEFVHTIMIEVPIDVLNACVFIGSVEGGTGIQLNMNRKAIDCIKIVKIEALL
jgi:hypothetical protein